MTAEDHHVQVGAPALLDARSGDAQRDQRPLTDAQVARGARLAQHGACVDHVKLDGLAIVVCILPGQDPAVVVAEAAALVAPLRAMTAAEVDEVAPSQLPAEGDELDLRAQWGDR